MFPWLGQIPGMPQQGGGMDIISLIRQLMQQQGGGGGGGFSFQRPPQQYQFNDPRMAAGIPGAQTQQPFGRIFDNRGLSQLWSPQVGQTTTGPGGWQTAVNRPNSPIGGLLGRIGNMFG